MLNNQEYLFIKDLTISMYNKDYNYYLCYTNNENTYNQSYYDVFCYYSKNNLVLNNYTLTISSNSIKCSFDSKNSYSNYKNNSLNCSESFDTSISINSKEFIYSNIGNNSDLIAEYQKNLKYFDGFKLISTSILFIVIIIFLYKFIGNILRS